MLYSHRIIQALTYIPQEIVGLLQWLFIGEGGEDIFDPIRAGELSDNSNLGEHSGTPRECHCASFDGVDDYVVLESNSFWNISSVDAMSCSMWLNIQGSSNDEEYIFSIDDTPVIYIPTATNDITFAASGGDETIYTTTRGEWVHIAFTRDTSNNLTLYANGSQVGTATDSSSWNLVNDAQIGRGFNVSTKYGEFKITDFRFYKEELTAADIQSIYNSETHDNQSVAPDVWINFNEEDQTSFDFYDMAMQPTISVIGYGLTLSSFRDTDNFTPVNWNNHYGYSVDGAKIIPKDINTSGNDTEGNSLDYSGHIKHVAKLFSPCYEFGTGPSSYIEKTVNTDWDYTKDLRVSYQFKMTDFGSQIFFAMEADNGDSYFEFGYDGTQFFIVLEDESESLLLAEGIDFSDGNEYHTVEMAYDSVTQTMECTMDEVPFTDDLSASKTISAKNPSPEDIYVISSNMTRSSVYGAGELFDFQVDIDGVADIRIPLTEGASSLVVELISGDLCPTSNFGSNWGFQPVFHQAIEKGFAGGIDIPKPDHIGVDLSAVGAVTEVEIDFYMKHLGAGGIERVFRCSGGANASTLQVSGGSGNVLIFRMSNSQGRNANGSISWGVVGDPTRFVHFNVHWTASSNSLIVEMDGVEVINEITGFPDWTFATVNIGADTLGGLRGWDGQLGRFSIKADGVEVLRYEGVQVSSDGTQIIDQSGNDNHGDITSGIELINFPLDLDGNVPVYDDTYATLNKQEAGQWHNYAKAYVNQYHIPEIIKADAFNLVYFDSNGDVNNVFGWDIADGVINDRLFADNFLDRKVFNWLLYKNILTGTDLTEIETYVND